MISVIPFCILAIEDDADRAFMTDLFLQYNRLMNSEVMKIVQDEWAADDIIQSILEKFIDIIDELKVKERKQLVNYIIFTCKNRSIDYLRRKKVRVAFLFDEETDVADDEQDRRAMEQKLIDNEEMNALVKIWSKLDKKSKWILEQKYIYSRSSKDIAQDMGIKPESVKMALVRARRAANELIRNELGTDLML